MDIASQKVELAKKLLETDNPEIISHFKAVFQTQSNGWWEQLPPEIQSSITRALAESEANQTIAHEEAMKPYKKWLEK